MKRSSSGRDSFRLFLVVSFFGCLSACVDGDDGARVCTTQVLPAVSISLVNSDGESVVSTAAEGVPFSEYRLGESGAWQSCCSEGRCAGSLCAFEASGTIEVRATYDELDYVYGSAEVAHDGCHPITEYVELVIDPPFE